MNCTIAEHDYFGFQKLVRVHVYLKRFHDMEVEFEILLVRKPSFFQYSAGSTNEDVPS